MKNLNSAMVGEVYRKEDTGKGKKNVMTKKTTEKWRGANGERCRVVLDGRNPKGGGRKKESAGRFNDEGQTE